MSLTVIVGGQYGSEAKGAATAGVIERDLRPTYNVRVAGPNAGHTAHDPTGRAWPLRQIPVGAVADHPDVTCVIAAGSEIDPDVLFHELGELNRAELKPALLIDPQATVLDTIHKETEAAEQLVGRIGSTGKGIGAARASRVMRTAWTYGQWWARLDGWRREAAPPPWDNTAGLLNDCAASARRHVVIEGTQGYGLGLHAGHYPQCTSSDCRAIDFLAMAGVSPWVTSELEVLVCMRVYPIRVAGSSGPMRDETSWDALGLPVELTTVTRKPRRVGLWDGQLAADAIRANPGGRIHLSMLDQLPGAVLRDGDNRPHVTDLGWEFVQRVEGDTGAEVAVIGCGPRVADQLVVADL